MACRNPYIVLPGDTLSNIGRRCGVSWQLIASLNSIRPPYVIRPGQTLQLPGSTSGGGSGGGSSTPTYPTFAIYFETKSPPYVGLSNVTWFEEQSSQLSGLLASNFTNIKIASNYGYWGVPVAVTVTARYQMTAAQAAAIVNRLASTIAALNQNSFVYSEITNTTTDDPTISQPKKKPKPGSNKDDDESPNEGKSIFEVLANAVFLSLGIAISANTVAAIVVGGVLIMWFTRD